MTDSLKDAIDVLMNIIAAKVRGQSKKKLEELLGGL